MFVRSSSFVSVDADSASVKVVELREQGGILVLAAAAVRAVPAQSNAAAVLQELLKGTGVKERRCALVLPQGAAWVQHVEIALGEDPVSAGINLATRELPFGADELAGAACLDASGQHSVAVVPRAILETALACPESSGLRPLFVTAHSLALAAAAPGQERILLVEISADGTELVLAQAGKVCASRHLSVGLTEMARLAAAACSISPQQAFASLRSGADASQAECISSVAVELAAEAELLLTAQSSTSAPPTTRVLLAGDGASAPGLSLQLTTVLHLPVDLMDACAGLECQGSAAALSAQDRAALVAAVGAAKLALARGSGVGAPDLLPESRRNARRWSPKTVAACALVFLLVTASSGAWVMCGFGPLEAAIKRKQDLLRVVKSREARLLHLAGLRAEKSDIDERGRIIREIASSRVPWTRKLDELWQVTSESDAAGASMWLNTLSVKAQDARATAGRKSTGEIVSIQGYCLAERQGDPLQRFNTFHERLKSSAFFTGSFESINNPAGKSVQMQDGRPAWTVALDLQMALRTPEKSDGKAALAKVGG
ncbi:MAG: hypothetical protein EXS14_04215 [Planctomycetes bacterium]|nr:hypothetical protein [Planctomycetota bacterium]